MRLVHLIYFFIESFVIEEGRHGPEGWLASRGTSVTTPAKSKMSVNFIAHVSSTLGILIFA